ncbi:MotA/TolQ/ExbB proton channel family protein [candidate division KSB1 bacterium]|nr:MotA/TolQ/ExbB proton channel family protein [candidate division KSB1 bacterium]
MNLLELVAQGGWIMVPLLICAVVAAAIIFERLMILRKSKSNTRHLMMKLRSLVTKGQKEEALNLCAETPGSAAMVLKEGIRRSGRDREEIQMAVESAGKEQVFHLEKYLGILATIAGMAPLIGFLGTVLGMIEAFMVIQRESGNVNATVLAGGISQALITTAAGLIVGIITYFFYNYIVSKIKRFVFEIETSSNELVELLTEDQFA